MQAPSELTSLIYFDIFVSESTPDTAGAGGVLASAVIRAVTTTGEDAGTWRGLGTCALAQAVTG